MKKIMILFLVFLLSIFVSCKSNNTNNIENKDDHPTSTDPSSDIEDDKEIDPDENEKEKAMTLRKEGILVYNVKS